MLSNSLLHFIVIIRNCKEGKQELNLANVYESPKLELKHYLEGEKRNIQV